MIRCKGQELTKEHVQDAVDAGLQIAGNHSRKQAFQRLLERVSVRDGVVCYKGTNLLVVAQEDWPGIVLREHGKEHLSPARTFKEVSFP